uniref:Flavin-containing monooxygenase n=1 Tax=Parascaris equorum TaxID=6256 RepID=A0A914RYI2_PAREQ
MRARAETSAQEFSTIFRSLHGKQNRDSCNEIEIYTEIVEFSETKCYEFANGLIQPIGSIAPISELQSRWVAAVFSGQIKLPSKTEMLADIAYYKSTRHTLQVDYMKYMDELAELIGCKPNVWKYVLTDPMFALQLFFGANAPYAYRLQGMGKWEGAKNALKTLPERVKKPMKCRNFPMNGYKQHGAIMSR